MGLLGSKHVTGVRHRIMTTMKIGLKFKDKQFPPLCCKAWDVFVRRCRVVYNSARLVSSSCDVVTFERSGQEVDCVFQCRHGGAGSG